MKFMFQPSGKTTIVLSCFGQSILEHKFETPISVIIYWPYNGVGISSETFAQKDIPGRRTVYFTSCHKEL